MQKIIRVLITLIVSAIFLNSLVFIIVAFYRMFHAYVMVATGKIENRPGVYIAESLDAFMLALFSIIMSLGIAKLFLPRENFFSKYELPWFKVETFSELKYIIWEVLLTTLFIYFASSILIIKSELQWSTLIFPASILMLAIAFKLLKKNH